MIQGMISPVHKREPDGFLHSVGHGELFFDLCCTATERNATALIRSETATGFELGISRAANAAMVAVSSEGDAAESDRVKELREECGRRNEAAGMIERVLPRPSMLGISHEGMLIEYAANQRSQH
jgi:hypothetical protein